MSSREATVPDAEFKSENRLLTTVKEFRHSPTSMMGLVTVLALVGMAIFATIDHLLLDRAIITALHADPYEMDTTNRYASPSWEHPMGTDNFGRDVLARVIYGSRTALAIGIIAVGISFTGGVMIGVVAAYFGGYIDDALMRFVETLYAIPGLILAMTFMAIFGANIYNLFLAYGIVGIPSYARVMRSEALSIRDREYVEAAKVAGLPTHKILFREIVPNGVAPVVVQATLSMGGVIIGAAALSFLGFGVQPPTPDWGRMLSEGRTALIIAPWVAFFPGMMIFLTVIGFNMLGDGLRDIMDPQTTLHDPDWESVDTETYVGDTSVADEAAPADPTPGSERGDPTPDGGGAPGSDASGSDASGSDAPGSDAPGGDSSSDRGGDPR